MWNIQATHFRPFLNNQCTIHSLYIMLVQYPKSSNMFMDNKFHLSLEKWLTLGKRNSHLSNILSLTIPIPQTLQVILLPSWTSSLSFKFKVFNYSSRVYDSNTSLCPNSSPLEKQHFHYYHHLRQHSLKRIAFTSSIGKILLEVTSL